MAGLELHIASTLGLLLAASLVAGLLAELIHLPKVTAYLLIGLVLGPSFLDIVPHDHAKSFDPMLKLAMSLVLFNLGSQFAFKRVRKIARRGLALSIGELGMTFALVTLGLLLFGTELSTAAILGALALATAPATTVLVLKEFRSEGPITDNTGFLVAVNNFASIVAFESVFLWIQITNGDIQTDLMTQFGLLSRDIAGSLVLGLLAGLFVSFCCGFIPSGRWLVLLVAGTTFALGLCESLDIPYMLTFLVMGVTVANTSEFSHKIVEELDHLTGLLCVLFFAVHGAELDVHAFLAAGMIGVVYIALRSTGKWLGIYTAARIIKQPSEVRLWLGTCLFAQAGAAIALAEIAAHRDPELGTPIKNIILGTVVFFEIIGPLLIRQSLLHAGEVPLTEAIHHTSRTPLEQFRDLVDSLRLGLTRSPITQGTEELTIQRLIRPDVGIRQTANMDQVINHIEHSHDNTYAVVNEDRVVVGKISYPQLSNAMFDTTVSQLVCAEDLAIPVDVTLHPDDLVSKALNAFHNVQDDCLPVVEREEPHALVGMLRKSDLMHLLIKQHIE